MPAGVTPSSWQGGSTAGSAAAPQGAVVRLRLVATAPPPPPPAPASVEMEPCDPVTPPSHPHRVRLAYEEAADLLCDPDLDLVLELFAGPAPCLPGH